MSTAKKREKTKAKKKGVSAETLRSISTPDRVESRLGTLEFDDGAPSAATAELLYDHLDFLRGVEAFIGAYPGASLAAIRRGFLSIGVEDNAILLFLGPDGLGVAVPDRQLRHGLLPRLHGPDRRADGARRPTARPAVGDPRHDRRHVVPLGHRLRPPRPRPGQGAVPDRRARLRRAAPGQRLPRSARAHHAGDRARPGVHGRQRSRARGGGDPRGLPHLPTCPAAEGTAVAAFLAGEPTLGAGRTVPEQRFVEASGSRFNTIAPNDFGYWETVDELVQQEPPARVIPSCWACWRPSGSSRQAVRARRAHAQDPRGRRRRGQRHGPHRSRSRRRRRGFAFYPGSWWISALLVGGYQFLDPPPQITAEGVVRSPSDGARKLNSRIWFFYPATGVTPAMCMRLTGIGSQYLIAMRGGNGEYLDGRADYRLTLPPDIPQSRFWSVILYDRQTRSMLQTDQPKPDLGSQSGTVETNPDGSTDIYLGPTAPEGKSDNWLQTVPGKGCFVILRLYNPLEPFFDKTWRPSEIEPLV